MGFMHQQLIEVLSYAMVLTVRWVLPLCVCGMNVYQLYMLLGVVCRGIIYLHQELLERMLL